MDHGREALMRFFGAQCDALELFGLAEEVLDQMPPFIHLLVNAEGLASARVLRDDDLCSALIEIGDQCADRQPLDQRRDVDCIEALPGHEREAHEIAERVRERQYLSGHPATRLADGLA